MTKRTLYSSSSRSGRTGREPVPASPESSPGGAEAPGRSTPAGAPTPSHAFRAPPLAPGRHFGPSRALPGRAAETPRAAHAPDDSGRGDTMPTPASARRPPGRYSWRRIPAVGWMGAVALAALGLALHARLQPDPRQYTQQDIDRAVLHTLERATLPSAARKAFEVIHPSVVRVRGVARNAKDGKRDENAQSTGTGVIVVDSGLILTNLHVIDGAAEVEVTFADGTQSPAIVISTQPHNDLAVLQATTLPDDVVPATLRGTADLSPGDTVVAVGYPFGIGPSVSAGVVSGLKREYQSLGGKTTLSNLIQFDAAANPGSSGGPLVTAEGEVVGIVTAILNPSEQRVFIGIGFAVPIENAAGGMGLPPH